MDLAEIEKRTRDYFPELGSDLRFDCVEKGGSGRLFYRLWEADEPAGIIVMSYKDDRPDNVRFAPVSDFLAEQNVPVPAILAREEEEGVLWVQDLGAVDLTDAVEEDWQAIRRIAYEHTLRSVFLLHRMKEASVPENLPELEIGFDQDLYLWEQHYFFDHYVSNFREADAAALRDHESLLKLAQQLADEPRALLHRDFQSTNVMIHDGLCYLIDYQGLRWGVPEYDVASMIYDPYVDFAPEEQDHLIRFYFSLKQEAGDTETFEAYEKRLYQSAVQRLMQALGAYGNLGLNVGKKEFLDHIPTAERRLRRIAVDKGAAPILGEILPG